MSTTRMLAPLGVGRGTISVPGNRTVTADPVTGVADVDSGDSAGMAANGWLLVSLVGTTSQRPALGAPQRGTRFTDLTLNAEILWRGDAWINPATLAVV